MRWYSADGDASPASFSLAGDCAWRIPVPASSMVRDALASAPVKSFFDAKPKAYIPARNRLADLTRLQSSF